MSCSKERTNTRFTLLSADSTNIDFENTLESTPELNIQNYGYFYDGGGVAVGDINNDGLPDIYFVGNQKLNKLYLNKGGFVFEDITESAGVGGDTTGWSTGATMADVNGDGFLDIYVSRVNYMNRTGANQLFINNGDNTFTEQASEYGLDFEGYSKQAVFFDYNGNGRLDLFLLNHSFHSERTRGRADQLRAVSDAKAGDRLYRNDGNTFTDVTEESGIYSSSLGYGLGVAVSDINKDGWPDIYVGNDYHEDDYLYINNGDGSFTEALSSSIEHTSKSSMGNDIGDLNNDGNVEIFSLDMLPEDNMVLNRSGIIDSYDRIQTSLRFGFKPQYSHNTLQLNRGYAPDGTPLFSDIGFAAGVAATDWSWATLMMDMDNDGLKDIYITNGIVGRPTDMDYNRVLQQEGNRISLSENIDEENLELIEEMPPVKIPNYAYENNGDLTFTNKAKEWGLDQPSYSSGAAYADLNNNGRLDLIVNNVNMPSFVYRNNTAQSDSSNYLKINLKGEGLNTHGIGTKVILHKDGQTFFQEQMPTRGFQSSVDYTLHFGLGHYTALDSMTVIWPDRSFQTLDEFSANRTFELDQKNASGKFDYESLRESEGDQLFRDITGQVGLDYSHQENRFNDFQQEPSLPYSMSTSGPAIARGDINGDGLDDLFLGGAHGQPGELYIQQRDGTFSISSSNKRMFEIDKAGEDVSAIFFDANGDDLLDLYVASGGNELQGNDEALKDRLYINQGEGRFRKKEDALPNFYENGSVVAVEDFNGDGYEDLFIGNRKSQNYGNAPSNYLLQNDGDGNFADVTDTKAPEMRRLGMVTDAEWAFLNGSKYPQLVVVGEWMPVSIFDNREGVLDLSTGKTGLDTTNGLWNKLLVDDFNGDGKPDIIAGNFGKNSRLKTSADQPLRLYIQDFEDSGRISSILAYHRDGNYFPFEPLDVLVQRFNLLGRKITDYTDYSTKSIAEIFGEEIIDEARVKEIHTLASVFIENRGNNTFEIAELPPEAQFSPVMGIYSGDANKDGNKDILLSGNLYDVKPSIGGRQDASYGLVLKGDGNGRFESLKIQSSGFQVKGEGREIIPVVTAQNDTLLIVARNNRQVQIFKKL